MALTESDLQEDIGVVYVKTFLDDMMIDFKDEINIDEEYSVEIPDSFWNVLEEGNHTITIFASNDEDSDERNYTFSKYVTPLYFPIISGNDCNLGNRSKPFSQSFYIDDYNTDVDLSFAVYINEETNTIMTENNVVRKDIYTLEITQNILDSLEYGVNKIIIKAMATDGGVAYRKISFYKDNGDNYPPVINKVDSDLGLCDEYLLYTFKVDDQNEDDTLTTRIYLNGKMIDCIYNTKRNFEYSIFLNRDELDKLNDNESNTIQIIANDGYAMDIRTLTFSTKEQEKEQCVQMEMRQGVLCYVECKQYDNAVLQVKLFDEGYNFNLEDYRFKFVVRDMYNNILKQENDVRIDEDYNFLKIMCDRQVTENIGKYKGEIIMHDFSDKRVSTFDIIFLVRKGCVV